MSDSFEFSVDEAVRPSVERRLTGTTSGDSLIDSLPLPRRPYRTRVAVSMLRLYRRMAPRALRNRCVFEPSCSHYSELAFRQKGIWRGFVLTIMRLRRCRAGCGGIDYSFIQKEMTDEIQD